MSTWKPLISDVLLTPSVADTIAGYLFSLDPGGVVAYPEPPIPEHGALVSLSRAREAIGTNHMNPTFMYETRQMSAAEDDGPDVSSPSTKARSRVRSHREQCQDLCSMALVCRLWDAAVRRFDAWEKRYQQLMPYRHAHFVAQLTRREGCLQDAQPLPCEQPWRTIFAEAMRSVFQVMVMPHGRLQVALAVRRECTKTKKESGNHGMWNLTAAFVPRRRTLIERLRDTIRTEQPKCIAVHSLRDSSTEPEDFVRLLASSVLSQHPLDVLVENGRRVFFAGHLHHL